MHPLSNVLLTPLEEVGMWGLSHSFMRRIFRLLWVDGDDLLDSEQGIDVWRGYETGVCHLYVPTALVVFEHVR